MPHFQLWPTATVFAGNSGLAFQCKTRNRHTLSPSRSRLLRRRRQRLYARHADSDDKDTEQGRESRCSIFIMILGMRDAMEREEQNVGNIKGATHRIQHQIGRRARCLLKPYKATATGYIQCSR